MPPEPAATPASVAAPPLSLVFRAWLGVGAQSFGGGQATLALIRRAVVEQHRWVGEEEFARDLTLCQIAPGMNLIALTVVTGRRTGGAAGIAAALLGLLLPSVALTIVVTMFFGRLRQVPGVEAALRNGVVPAVVGVGAWSSWKTGAALLLGRGRRGKAFGLFLIAASALAAWLTAAPVFGILLAAAVVGSAAALRRRRETAP